MSRIADERTPLITSPNSTNFNSQPASAFDAGPAVPPPSELSARLEIIADKAEWEDDKYRSICPRCAAPFQVTLTGTSRSHCRACGSSCCSKVGCATRLPFLKSQSAEKSSSPQPELKVCQLCFHRISELRKFLVSPDYSSLSANHPRNRSATKFRIHFLSSTHFAVPFETEFWLSESMMLFMYKDADGGICGFPVNKISDIKVGLYSDQLRSLATAVSCFCFPSPTTIGKNQNNLFTILYANGQTITAEASSPADRQLWTNRLTRLYQSLSYFTELHMNRLTGPVSSLVAAESLRINKSREELQKIEQRAISRIEKKEFQQTIKDKYKNASRTSKV